MLFLERCTNNNGIQSYKTNVGLQTTYIFLNIKTLTYYSYGPIDDKTA